MAFVRRVHFQILRVKGLVVAVCHISLVFYSGGREGEGTKHGELCQRLEWRFRLCENMWINTDAFVI